MLISRMLSCRHSGNPQVWGSLCNVWDMAVGMVARSTGRKGALDFRALMQQQVAHQMLKPVRARSAAHMQSAVMLLVPPKMHAAILSPLCL